MKPSKQSIIASPKSDFDRLTVARFMERDVQYVEPQTKADRIALRMIEGFGAIPVANNKQQLVGIVSEYDLLASSSKVAHGVS